MAKVLVFKIFKIFQNIMKMIVENQHRADKYIPRLFLLFFPYVGPVTKKLNAGLKKKKLILILIII